MRLSLAVLVLVLGARSVAGQDRGADSAVQHRAVTATAGLGNAMGWLGVQGEIYLAHSRMSLFAGLGYTPEFEDGDATGVAAAAGLRGYTGGAKHRGFLELSVSQLAVEASCFDACSRYYGPGLQVGYQFVSRGGFSILLSAGVGFITGGPTDRSEVGELLGLGVGYTWRR